MLFQIGELDVFILSDKPDASSRGIRLAGKMPALPGESHVRTLDCDQAEIIPCAKQRYFWVMMTRGHRIPIAYRDNHP